MFFRFEIFFLSLLFGINLYAASVFEAYSSWMGIVFSLVLIIAAKLIVGNWRYLVFPAILVPGSVFLLFLIDSVGQKNVFGVLASVVFYFVVLAGWRLKQYEKDETAKAMYNLATIASLFIWYAAAYGWYLNISLSVWGLITVFAVITFLASVVSFSINQIEAEKSLVYSVFLTMLISQTVWIQNFWPFGYLTTSVIALIIFCVGWETILNYFLGKISVRSIIFEIIFLVGSVALVLLSTEWYPVI